MKTLGRLLGFVFSLFSRRRNWRPAFPVRQEFVEGHLSAGTIYRLLRDRDPALPA